MDKVNEDYWYNHWHLDHETHKALFINSPTQIDKSEPVSIYGDTDSIFVSFKPAMDHCNWQNLIFNNEYLSNIDENFIILSKEEVRVENNNLLSQVTKIEDLKDVLSLDYKKILIDGEFVKDRELNKLIDDGVFTGELIWNWKNEVDFIQGMDKFKYEGYFKEKLNEHAAKYGVENKEDFELERISESIINLSKKKYIQHILHEDGIPYDRLNYIYPKGVELVRSSTPAFARVKIIDIVKYLFINPDTFNIKELLKLVKALRKEFELADIDDICMQSSVSKYDEKVLDDKNLPLQFVSGAHFAVKSAAHYNHLLSNSKYKEKYEFIRSGDKIKYYDCMDKSITKQFAYIRGSYPIEFAPEVDMDLQFSKSILSPINSIIESLGMPSITQRLSVVMDIFAGF